MYFVARLNSGLRNTLAVFIDRYILSPDCFDDALEGIPVTTRVHLVLTDQLGYEVIMARIMNEFKSLHVHVSCAHRGLPASISISLKRNRVM